MPEETPKAAVNGAPPKTVKVKLNQAHTHAREEYKAGDEIDVRPHTATYLEKRKIGTRA